MTAKEFLRQGWRIESRIRTRQAECERLRDRMLAVRASAPKSGPRGGRRADWTDAVAALEAAEDRLVREIAALCRAREQIDRAIASVPDVNQRRVLELRYRNYLTWEEIAREMPCDIRTVYRLHGRGLAQIIVPWFDTSRS